MTLFKRVLPNTKIGGVVVCLLYLLPFLSPACQNNMLTKAAVMVARDETVSIWVRFPAPPRSTSWIEENGGLNPSCLSLNKFLLLFASFLKDGFE
jgi:hypothetical protein